MFMKEWTKYCKCGKHLEHLESFNYKESIYYYCCGQYCCGLYYDDEGNLFSFVETFKISFEEIEKDLKEQKLELELKLLKETKLKEKEDEKKRIEEESKKRIEEDKISKKNARDFYDSNVPYLYHLTSKDNILSILKQIILFSCLKE